MNDLIDKLKYKYKTGDISIRLIFICTAVFVVSSILNFLFFRNSTYQIEDFFTAEASLNEFIKQPWGVVSYLFFHGGLLHLVINMLMLYFVGQTFLRYFRKNDFLIFFFCGGLVGAIAFMLFSGLIHYSGNLIGASAGVYSVFFALTAYIPKTKVQLFPLSFSIPLDYIAYGLLAYDVIMIFSGNNSGGHISHLGGAGFGYFYMKQFEKGNDFIGKLFQMVSNRERKPKLKVNKTPPRDDYEFNAQKLNKQKEIDKILDKISRSGYESLSKEEKDILFKAGK